METHTQWSEQEEPGDVITAVATAAGPMGELTLFAGSTIGIRRSADLGNDWEASTCPGGALSLVTSLAVSTGIAVEETVFAGTFDGCYRSTDGGRTFHPVLSGGPVLSVVAVGVMELEQGVALVSGGVVFVGTESDGVLRSLDGGASWQAANAGLLDLSVLALSVSPSFDSDRTGFLATSSGVYRTRNGGKAWRSVEVSEGEPAVQSLAVSPTFNVDQVVLAGTEDSGLQRSVDAGETWEPVGGLEADSVTAVVFSSDGTTIAAGTERGVAVTSDGGASWRWDGEVTGPVLSLCFGRRGGREVLVAGLLRRGIGISEEPYEHWTFPLTSA